MKNKMKVKNYFEMNLKYHYYEPTVYDLGEYFEGLNARQLNTIMFIFGQFSMGYTHFFKMVEYNRKDSTITENEEKIVKLYEECIGDVNLIVDSLLSFKDDEYPNRTYQDSFTKNLNGRVWVKPAKELVSEKWVCKKIIKGEEIVVDLPKGSHIVGIYNDLPCIYKFGGHWLGYLKESYINAEWDFPIETLVNLCPKLTQIREYALELDYVKNYLK